jgi:hypothetical protein
VFYLLSLVAQQLLILLGLLLAGFTAVTVTPTNTFVKNLHGSGSIASSLKPENPGSILDGSEIFVSTKVSRSALGPLRFLSQLNAGPLSLRVKQPGREAYHSPPFNAEVKSMWSYTFFMSWCLAVQAN